MKLSAIGICHLKVLLPHVSSSTRTNNPCISGGCACKAARGGLPPDGPLMLGIVYTYMYTRTVNRVSTNHEIVSAMFVCISVCVG